MITLSSVKTERGLTLIETVLYLALFAIIFTTIIEFSMSISESNRNALERNELSKALLFVYEHVDEVVGASDTIVEAQTVFENDSGVLVLTELAVSKQYSISGGRLVYTSQSIPTPVTPSSLTVTRFFLQPIRDKDEMLVGTRVEISMTSKSGSVDSINSSYLLKQ